MAPNLWNSSYSTNWGTKWPIQPYTKQVAIPKFLGYFCNFKFCTQKSRNWALSRISQHTSWSLFIAFPITLPDSHPFDLFLIRRFLDLHDSISPIFDWIHFSWLIALHAHFSFTVRSKMIQRVVTALALLPRATVLTLSQINIPPFSTFSLQQQETSFLTLVWLPRKCRNKLRVLLRPALYLLVARDLLVLLFKPK